MLKRFRDVKFILFDENLSRPAINSRSYGKILYINNNYNKHFAQNCCFVFEQYFHRTGDV